MMSLFLQVLVRLSRHTEDDRDGQALVEYSLIIVLVIIACLTIVATTGDVIRDELWGMTRLLPFMGGDDET